MQEKYTYPAIIFYGGMINFTLRFGAVFRIMHFPPIGVQDKYTIPAPIA